jgi:signal recognition particle GTPase
MKKNKTEDEIIESIISEEPTQEPKEEPKEEPTQEPKEEPKEEPAQEPKEEPKQEPAQEPTQTAEPTTEKKKETRGRKKKNVSSARDKFADFKPIEEPAQATAEPVYNNLISGYMLLMIIDVLMPYLSFLICKLLLKKEIDWKKIKIGSSDLKEFEPIADEVAKKISMKITPEIALTIMLGGLYFTKTALVLTETENKKK